MGALKTEKIRRLNITVYPSTIIKAEELASEQGRSVSNFIRWLIDVFYSEQHQQKEQSKIA